MEQLGEVAAVNASLNIVLADRDVALAYDGGGPDNARAIEFLVGDDYRDGKGHLHIAGEPTLVFSLEGMMGIASLHLLEDGRHVLIEPSLAELGDDEEVPSDYLAQVDTLVRETKPQEELGVVEVPSGVLVVGDVYDSLSAHEEELSSPREGVIELNAHLGSVGLRLTPGAYRITRARQLDLGWAEFGMAWIEKAAEPRVG